MGYYQPNKEKADNANGGNYITANRMTENIKGNRNTQGRDKIQITGKRKIMNINII